MTLRAATPEDGEAICAIWNPVIRDTGITFNAVEKTPNDICAMIDEKAALGFAFLVVDAGGVQGFGTYGQFRSGVGYARTAEHSIILGPDARGKGVGRTLMAAVEADAKAQGFHSMFAGVSGENPGAVKFHAALGYAEVATLREVGYKFDRWFDLVLMQKML
ncbi:GNAT family N-acetyltransferase [Cognatishimia sp. MH4019]|uniref:GNAT family N-acetyltransferase n=1 Tax=Cognatishimia sp. MH4019 TaxID=2854030 RepID=UPI001CD4C4B0|nr:GNAT family N-acetyltransferase [Cognatishimia sp. MH4019]